MANHSQKWHDGSSNRNLESTSNKTEGMAAIVNKLENLGRDMKKLKESVHAIQVGYQNCEGVHLDKDCPLNEEVKSIEEAKYGEFRCPLPFSNEAKYRVGPLGYYTRIDNLYSNRETSLVNEPREASLVQEKVVTSKTLPCQLPPKELNPRNFTLPCTVRSLNFYAMADLGASVNVIPKSMFEHLRLARLKKTDMLVEMANMTKKSPLGIVENVLVWPTCDPTIKTCNGGFEIFGMNEDGNLKKWSCYLDIDRGNIKGSGLSFPDFLSIKYGEVQKKELIWDDRYEEWCNKNLNPDTPTLRFTSALSTEMRSLPFHPSQT
ncbi:7-deoxyloganetin glucosyltransferase-like protein [Tanacetum coccineum]|uniref:7-deoxyloganetin glucosyltransferase-like protein n=1 Tax=Tanacetum coccineum TaxID=301880 RepID=A0ABQ5A1R1_9ASTR